jgi:hypothetical protein
LGGQEGTVTSEPSGRDEQVVTLWKFVRGDLGPRDFERWACESQALEAVLGPVLGMDVISADYRDPVALGAMRGRLEAHLRSLPNRSCECVTVADVGVVDMGAHEAVFASLEEVAIRGDPYWWLWAAHCRKCGQGWLVGSEERQNDVYCMRRLSAAGLEDVVQGRHWPPDFDHYESLLEIGRRAGRSVRFIEPLTSGSLRATMTDLARDRPGVALSAIAAVLNLDLEVAEQIAVDVMREPGVVIDLKR